MSNAEILRMTNKGSGLSSSSSSGPVEDCERESVGSEEEDEEEGWDDWAVGAENEEEDEETESVQCLFCSETQSSAASIFNHCSEQHSFDFVKLRRDRRLEFYECLGLINYIRSEVAANGPEHALDTLKQQFKVSEHLGASTASSSGGEQNAGVRSAGEGLVVPPWSDEKYLTPFLENDSLLYTFDDGEDGQFDDIDGVDDVNVGAERLRDLSVEDRAATSAGGELELTSQLVEDLREDTRLATPPEIAAYASALLVEDMSTEGAPDLEEEQLSDCENQVDTAVLKSGERKFELRDVDGLAGNAIIGAESIPTKKKKGKVTFAAVAEKEKLIINRSYFGSYSGFGIHREMLGDKVRTEAYQTAIIENPSLLKDSVVMDVGCGTGILSLFAAKAGARKVIAVDGSEKMTAVATQVAKVNGYLDESAGNEEKRTKTGVITVVAGMIEELNNTMPVPDKSVDVLVSEWMGYCLLFESMLGSVLYARDKWLKPGGAMLPDTATMYVAGFGKGGTSLSFWENVYGFDMQCVGEEVVQDATQHPIIDVIASKDVITDTCLLKEFDLTSMKHDDVDYTADFGVKLLPAALDSPAEISPEGAEPKEISGRRIVKCYGLVVWFDTAFSSRFCKEKPVNLTTSPHSPKTHWSQTLLTFKEPICLCAEETKVDDQNFDRSRVGSYDFPAYSINGRISIARSFRFRSIDISLEATALGAGGASKSWPVQIFDI
ncbi:unnamed protein product [Calypogeia fissa]